MANYKGRFRSNYFGVKDVEAFQAFCEQHDLEFIEKDSLCGFLMNEGTEGGFQTTGWDEESEEETDTLDELCQHLAEGQVAIVMEVGYEKMRYLIGRAWVMNAAGESTFLDLTDLAIAAAKTLTSSQVTSIEY